MSETGQDLADKILKKFLDDDEQNSSRFGRQNFEKILDDDERNRSRFGRQNFEKILDDDERNEVKRKDMKRYEKNEIFYIWFKRYWN